MFRCISFLSFNSFCLDIRCISRIIFSIMYIVCLHDSFFKTCFLVHSNPLLSLTACPRTNQDSGESQDLEIGDCLRSLMTTT